MSHPVTDYAEDVVEGNVIAGKYVRWACQRHLNDLERNDIYFDEEAANRIINFYQLTPHVKGEWAGQPIELKPWQMFIVGGIFGWKEKETGLRRFNEAYIQIGRKNGKTTLMAVIGLYGLKYDNEPGSEVYAASTKRDQSKEIFDPAKQMAKKSDYLNDFEILKNNINHLESFSKFEPLSADYDTMDGKNIHFGLVDELHAHKDSGVWDVLADGTGSRRQPLMIAITTAGFDQSSFCYDYRNYCIDVLDPRKKDFKDDSQFVYIAELDEGDDWTEEKNWVKANPNLGVSVKYDDLRRRIKKAKRMPTERNKVKCKRLNFWTSPESTWMDMQEWDESACGDMQDLNEIKEILKGEKCYAAVDLSSKVDITAYVKLFPIGSKQGRLREKLSEIIEIKSDKKIVIVIPEFFIPKDTVSKRSQEDKVPYDVWSEDEIVNTTPGNAIYLDFIEKMIIEDNEIYNFLRFGRDRWGSIQLAQNLEGHDIEAVGINQGKALSEPMKEIEAYVLENRLVHFNHPVLRWMAENTVAWTDAHDNIKPDKKKSRERIDGIVAMIMAMDGLIREEGDKESVYEKRGVRTL